jgi:hypothetical protein
MLLLTYMKCSALTIRNHSALELSKTHLIQTWCLPSTRRPDAMLGRSAAACDVGVDAQLLHCLLLLREVAWRGGLHKAPAGSPQPACTPCCRKQWLLTMILLLIHSLLKTRTQTLGSIMLLHHESMQHLTCILLVCPFHSGSEAVIWLPGMCGRCG